VGNYLLEASTVSSQTIAACAVEVRFLSEFLDEGKSKGGRCVIGYLCLVGAFLGQSLCLRGEFFVPLEREQRVVSSDLVQEVETPQERI
jgi:hypothetical protein